MRDVTGETLIGTASRVEVTHGVLQRLADMCGADLLHVKGPAVSPELLEHRIVDGKRTVIPRGSTDADVLVRPDHLTQFESILAKHGWRKVASFNDGSAFGHAANYWHDLLGYVDVHRQFPGIDIAPSQAFQALWTRRQRIDIAHTLIHTPSVTDQRLILLLHAARSGTTNHPDKVRCWDNADNQERRAVRALARDLDAQVALAAAIGELDQFRGHRTYDLWRHFSTGDPSRLHEWRARVRAAPTRKDAVKVALNALALNRPHLRMDLGHDLSRVDVARGYWNRTLKASQEVYQVAREQARTQLRSRRRKGHR
ncbi:nucleotidyltransferase family protein [Cutibacterium equinum]|uniref:Nucleotidyltransferase family protein n=1 Tax=Cutibacterium equinum TaxID=3016342 RepID=A0ABY7QYQ9_9ACTN|nr:nucleotidyltransferase family protein [Cutibacterium equinum]WCC80116.1 nucleotidyltransferase family protein [Cutibacterium equinum]